LNTNAPFFSDLSMKPGGGAGTFAGFIYFNTPRDVVTAANRSIQFSNDPLTLNPLTDTATLSTMGITFTNPNDVAQGFWDSMICSDVVSFQIQALQVPKLPPPPGPPSSYPLNNAAPWEWQDLPIPPPPGGAPPTYPQTYDSSTATTGLLAIQITIRVFD